MPARWPVMFLGRATLAFIAVTPVLLLVVVFTAGAGHGTYYAAKILFPYTMATTAFTTGIREPFVAVGIVQYPLYGVLLDCARYVGRFKPALLALAGVHFVAIVLAFLISDPSFTP
jgi:hypothetical protein